MRECLLLYDILQNNVSRTYTVKNTLILRRRHRSYKL